MVWMLELCYEVDVCSRAGGCAAGLGFGVD